MRHIRETRAFFSKAWETFSWSDLRWSHLSIVAMLLVAAVVQFTMDNGWTIWPMVPVVAMLVFINEAADRNGQGVPPFQVYAFFALVLVVWTVSVIILSKVNVFIQLLSFCIMAYYAAKAYLKQRERLRIIESRRNEGCCINCGEPADPENLICEECGLEVDPERSSAQRTASIALYGKRTDRARGVLTPQSLGNIAASKEQALLANSPRRRAKPPKR
jgi:hypothetical protein